MVKRIVCLLLLAVFSALPMLTERRVSFCEIPRIRHLIKEKDLTSYQMRLKVLNKELSFTTQCIEVIRKSLVSAHGNSAETLREKLARCCAIKTRLERDIKAINTTMKNSVVC